MSSFAFSHSRCLLSFYSRISGVAPGIQQKAEGLAASLLVLIHSSHIPWEQSWFQGNIGGNTSHSLEASLCAAKNANYWEQVKRENECHYRLTTPWLETTTASFKLLSGQGSQFHRQCCSPLTGTKTPQESFRVAVRLWTCGHPSLLHTRGTYISTINLLWEARAEIVSMCCDISMCFSVFPRSGYYDAINYYTRWPLESYNHFSHKQNQFPFSQWIHLNTGLSSSIFRTKMP